jgi:tetratricopeptide (TPR) repeat protein
MPSPVSLADHPALRRWFQERATAPDASRPAELLVWRTCDAIASGPDGAVRRWLDAFNHFLKASKEPLADFLAAEAIMHSCDAELLDLIGELGELAANDEGAGSAAAFGAAMRAGADRTGLVVLRFLSAWTALNTGRLDECVNECEKVDEPFGALFTVHGQALLELGRAGDAAEVLEIATKLAPAEILSWFQLAKAYHVLGRGSDAFGRLRECRRLAPQSDEVALYMGLVALDEPARSPLAHEAITAMRPIVKRHADNPAVIYSLLRLACRAGEKPVFKAVLGETTWPRLNQRPESLRQLAPVLRELQAAGWMEMAAQLLEKVTAPATAGS